MKVKKRKARRPDEFKDIPVEMKRLDQWVIHRGKIPFCPDAPSRNASVNKPSTWGTFDDAVAAYLARKCDGIGFVFTSDDDIIGIDLDACRDPQTKRIAEWALRIIKQFNSYTEVSLSGHGCHVIIRGKMPGTKTQRKITPEGVETFGEKTPEIAVSSAGRYFAITGNCIREKGNAKKATKAVASLIREHFPTKKKAVRKKAGSKPGLDQAIDQGIFETLIANCRGATDRSKADFRLCRIAFLLGWPREAVWNCVRDESKFAKRGREYFDRTWDAAANETARIFSNGIRLSKDMCEPIALPMVSAQLLSLCDG